MPGNSEVLLGYSRIGRAPTPEVVADALDADPTAVAHILARLRSRDLVVIDAAGHVTGAYPFTDRATGHRVALGSREIAANCAIDALGIGAMLDADSVIRSLCGSCGRPVEIVTSGDGQRVPAFSPDRVIVWSGAHAATGCAASSLCTVQLFFCCDEHLHAWRDKTEAGADGIRLSLEEAMQVACALFVPMLREASALHDEKPGTATGSND
jgi:hypothetical protein